MSKVSSVSELTSAIRLDNTCSRVTNVCDHDIGVGNYGDSRRGAGLIPGVGGLERKLSLCLAKYVAYSTHAAYYICVVCMLPTGQQENQVVAPDGSAQEGSASRCQNTRNTRYADNCAQKERAYKR